MTIRTETLNGIEISISNVDVLPEAEVEREMARAKAAVERNVFPKDTQKIVIL